MSNIVYVGTLGDSPPPRATLSPVVQGSTESLHTITVKYADSTAYDLTGKTVTGLWWLTANDTVIYDITGTIAVTSAANGTITWDKSAADVGTGGRLAVQFVITDNGDSETDATFPAAMDVETRGEATNVIAGDTIDGGNAITTPITEIDGGDAEGA